MQQEIQQETQRQPGKESEIRDTYAQNPQFAAALESSLLEDKVVDFILEGSNLQERVLSPDQFMSEEESEKVESTNQSKTVKKKASKKKKKWLSQVNRAFWLQQKIWMRRLFL